MYTGPHLIKDNLVFGYDTGYGVADNSTATRFYPGEPTTNLYTNSDFSNGETGWTFGSWSSNAVTHTATTVLGPNGKTVSANRLTVNAASSYSHFHQYNGSKYTSGNTYTTSAWVKGQGTFQIKSHWGGNTSFTMTGDWQRVSMTVTATTSTNSNFPYFAGEGLTVGSTFYITDTQTELGGHATPYIYSGTTNGTRSSTESLLDLTKSTNIDVSNVSFGSDGLPTFDGTDDRVVSSTGINLSSYTSLTYEGVVKAVGLATHDRWFSGTAGSTYHNPDLAISTNGQLRYIFSGGGISSWITPSGLTIDTTKFNHLVYTFTNTGVVKIYINGTQEYTATHSSATFPNSSRFMTGMRFDNNGEGVVGSIPIAKVYSKALTADEVTLNYNAYKNRFDI